MSVKPDIPKLRHLIAVGLCWRYTLTSVDLEKGVFLGFKASVTSDHFLKLIFPIDRTIN